MPKRTVSPSNAKPKAKACGNYCQSPAVNLFNCGFITDQLAMQAQPHFTPSFFNNMLPGDQHQQVPGQL
ncbi:MAG: hypothetical protein WCJ56_11350 [bacterium]